MATNEPGLADDWLEIDRWGGGVGWIAFPEEPLQRASHALAVDGDVWVIDPVDFRDLDDLLAEFGTVRGVVVLLDRHKRDAATIATRHDVPIFVPAALDGLEGRVAAPVERFEGTLPGTDYQVIEILDNRLWQEFALFDSASRTLVIPEALGTTAYFRTEEQGLGVHPVLRLWPPKKQLSGLSPDRILVGHGEGIFEGATQTLEHALRTARRTAPRVYARGLLRLIPP